MHFNAEGSSPGKTGEFGRSTAGPAVIDKISPSVYAMPRIRMNKTGAIGCRKLVLTGVQADVYLIDGKRGRRR